MNWASEGERDEGLGSGRRGYTCAQVRKRGQGRLAKQVKNRCELEMPLRCSPCKKRGQRRPGFITLRSTKETGLERNPRLSPGLQRLGPGG